MKPRERIKWRIFLFLCLVQMRVSCCTEKETCACSMLGGTQNDTLVVARLDCSGRGLQEIPDFQKYKNSKIMKLNLSNNSFQSVTLNKTAFRGLSVDELDLSNNRFTEIREDTFRPLRSTLRHLILDNVGLGFENINFLKRMMKLERLSMRRNVQGAAVKLSGGRFPTSNLLQLDLSYNNFSKISDNAFVHLRGTLEVLYLENTGIDFKKLSFLTNLTRLQSVYLGRNGRYPLHLSGEPFYKLNLKSLRFLGLDKCEMAVVKENTFEGLEHLTDLDLSGNKLPMVPSAILKLANLVRINLSYNPKLTHIQNQAFVNLSKLKEINLRGTQLSTLSHEAFAGLEETLASLIVSDAKLRSGHYWIYALRPLRALKVLDFSYNKITHIINDTFGSLQSLQELDMSGNPMSDFTDTMFEGIELTLKTLKIRDMGMKHLPNDALAMLRYLKVLDASGNTFPILTDHFFAGIKARKLIMKNSNIREISPGAFHGLKGPLEVIFDGNNISDVSCLHDLSPHLIKNISLVDNPLKCACDILGIVYYKIAGTVHGTCEDLTGRKRTLQHLPMEKAFVKDCGFSCGSKSTFHTGVLFITIFLIVLKSHS